MVKNYRRRQAMPTMHGYSISFIILLPTGQAGFVLSKGSLTTKTSNEGEIRKALIENDLIDCIVNLPSKLFLEYADTCLSLVSETK